MGPGRPPRHRRAAEERPWARSLGRIIAGGSPGALLPGLDGPAEPPDRGSPFIRPLAEPPLASPDPSILRVPGSRSLTGTDRGRPVVAPP
jgi:hypothetical protein